MLVKLYDITPDSLPKHLSGVIRNHASSVYAHRLFHVKYIEGVHQHTSHNENASTLSVSHVGHAL